MDNIKVEITPTEQMKIALESDERLCEDFDTMKKSVEIDIGLINYDKTDDIRLYKYIIEQIEKEYLELNKAKETRLYGYDNEDPKDMINGIKSILNGKSTIASSKYEMPVKYLKQLIRNMCSNLEENSEKRKEFYIGLSKFHIIGCEIYSISQKYLELNGILPKNFGETIEKLYYSEENILGIHGTTQTKDMIIEKIFTQGLKCDYGADLSRVAYLRTENLDDYNRFLSYVYKNAPEQNAILIVIPKEDIDKGKPIWRQYIDKNIIETNEEQVFLDPKYLYGLYNVQTGFVMNQSPELIENPNRINSVKDNEIDKNKIAIIHLLDEKLQSGKKKNDFENQK